MATDQLSIDLDRNELVDSAGRQVVLRRRSLGLLIHLAGNAGHVVSKQELAEANWPGLAVTDDSLARCVSDIRSALGPELRRTLRTVSGRGYMLCGWIGDAGGRCLLAPAADHGRPTATDQRPSIAVLPFENLGDDEDAYFADGIAEDIIAALSRLRWLFVIARSSSFAYRGKELDTRGIAKELGVRYVLEGSVRKQDGRVRLIGLLVESETGRQLWAGRYDGDLTDIFQLQDRVAASVLEAVEPNLRLAEIERARRKPPGSLDAYDLYLGALPFLYAYTEASFCEAEGLLRAALRQDEAYSDALAALADCVGRMALNGWAWDRNGAFAESCALARRAVAADPENPLSLATAAWSYAMFSNGFDDALELADRALELHPSSHAIRSYCGWVFVYAGESDRAIEQFKAARKMSPMDPRDYFALLGMAAAHFFAGRFEDTVRLSERIISLVPSHTIARRYLSAALARGGRLEEANAVASALLQIQPSYNLGSAGMSRLRHRWMLDLYVDGLRAAGIPAA
ncbi:tetratricopeptide repeat protein [Mesorhizobium sp. B3-2-1]|uniref:tetratricopeptide repeat protein n=1 Tax=Mesorhizobium sp. B3-2-1 TaxID=2589891 RepID=UPI001126EFB6|nr:winged helix-turn-helix domain-containing protein [Mesorhizobium sp. B3-2-1]TPI31990.1 tetratricopeptide repeat protein [Mesorhizobium sp. B3-2-1]